MRTDVVVPSDISNGTISLICTLEELRLGDGLGHHCLDRLTAVAVELESQVLETGVPLAIVADHIIEIRLAFYQQFRCRCRVGHDFFGARRNHRRQDCRFGKLRCPFRGVPIAPREADDCKRDGTAGCAPQTICVFFLHLCALSGPRGGKQFSRLAERVRFVDHNRYRRVTGAEELYEIGERAYRRVTKIGPQLTDFGQKEPQLEILEIGLGREGRDVELLQRFGVFGLRARKATLLQLLDDAIVPITSVCICPQSTI